MKHWFAHATMSKTELASRLEKMKPPVPVQCDKFMGRWYNIEAFPWSYVKGCTAQQAVYTRTQTKAGKPAIKIQNSCLSKGKLCTEEGLAEPAVGDGSNGQLIVNFAHFFASFSTHFTRVNLCVMMTHATGDQYEYALVGTPELDGLWLMSRNALPLPPAVRETFIAKAQAAGFDTSHLLQAS
jgi:apolipoprotein D and lipocalin family protein